MREIRIFVVFGFVIFFLDRVVALVLTLVVLFDSSVTQETQKKRNDKIELCCRMKFSHLIALMVQNKSQLVRYQKILNYFDVKFSILTLERKKVKYSLVFRRVYNPVLIFDIWHHM